MQGYIVYFTVDQIEEICKNPEKYQSWQMRKAIQDAATHHKYGGLDTEWLERVTETLQRYE